MKKNPILVTLPVIAILIALIFRGCIGNTEENLTFSIESKDGSYYIVGEIVYLESVRLSDGKKVNIDESTGEIITCIADDGINSFKLSWESGDNIKDTIIASSKDGRGIKLDHTVIKSESSADCPLPLLSEVEFKINGPDKDCNYSLSVSESVLEKGYSDLDILVSLTGKSGSYSAIKKWKRTNAGSMDIWVKSKNTSQIVAISEGLKYKDCEVFKCNQATKSRLTKEVKDALTNYIRDYKNHSIFRTISFGKNFTFIKDGIDESTGEIITEKIETSSFRAEVGVNGTNVKFGGNSKLKIISVSVSSSDCSTFKIKYSNQ